MPAGAARSLLPEGQEARPAVDGSAGDARLGLPPGIRACLFDLDGVLTQTLPLHTAAWKETFDSFGNYREEDD